MSEIPAQIGPYKIEGMLNKGGMSYLYVGFESERQEPIIVKVLSPRFLENQEVVQRFLNEAKIIHAADHPNIVKLHDSGEWEGGLYIAMEYIDGVTLRDYLLNNPFSLKRSLEILLEISYALCHLHTHHVIHRDLKPENILVTRSGQIKVIDFGIAQLLQPEKDKEERKGHFVGTPFYMSPEQRENPENVSYPSDLYSLGIIAYELLLGKPSQGQIVLSIIPKGLQKIVAKTLAPKVEDRYHDVVDFIGDISLYLHSNLIEKEQKNTDPLLEQLERLKEVSTKFLTPHLPASALSFLSASSWPPIAWSWASSEYPLLYLCESASYDIKSLITYAFIKGAIDNDTLFFHDPLKGVLRLNKMLMNPFFSDPLLFALASRTANAQGRYLSCGRLFLWKKKRNGTVEKITSSTAMALGIDEDLVLKEISFTYEPDDIFFITSLSQETEEDLWQSLIAESKIAPLQKMTDDILRKLNIKKPLKTEERVPYLFAFQFS
jgi:serine/threonine protein kinase